MSFINGKSKLLQRLKLRRFRENHEISHCVLAGYVLILYRMGVKNALHQINKEKMI